MTILSKHPYLVVLLSTLLAAITLSLVLLLWKAADPFNGMAPLVTILLILLLYYWCRESYLSWFQRRAKIIKIFWRRLLYVYFVQKLLLTIEFIHNFPLIEVPTFLIHTFSEDFWGHWDVVSAFFCVESLLRRAVARVEEGDSTATSADRCLRSKGQKVRCKSQEEFYDACSNLMFRVGRFELRVFKDTTWPLCRGYIIRRYGYSTGTTANYLSEYSTPQPYCCYILDFKLKDLIRTIWIVQSLLTLASLSLTPALSLVGGAPQFPERVQPILWAAGVLYFSCKGVLLLLFRLHEDLWSNNSPNFVKVLVRFFSFRVVCIFVLLRYFISFVVWAALLYWGVLPLLTALQDELGLERLIWEPESNPYAWCSVCFVVACQRVVVVNQKLTTKLQSHHDFATRLWCFLELVILTVVGSIWPGCFLKESPFEVIYTVVIFLSILLTLLSLPKWVELYRRSRPSAVWKGLHAYTYAPNSGNDSGTKRYQEFSIRNLLTIIIVRFWIDIWIFYFVWVPTLIVIWFIPLPFWWHPWLPTLLTLKKLLLYLYFTHLQMRVASAFCHELGFSYRTVRLLFPLLALSAIIFTNAVFLL